MAAANTLPRVIWVHTELTNGRPVSTRSIVGKFEGSLRSAQRTIEYMRDQLGAPVCWDARRNTYYYAEPGYELPTIPLTHGEAIALLVFYQGMLENLPLPLANELSQAATKLADFLPDTVSVNLQDVLARMSFTPEPHGEVEPAYLEVVRQGLDHRRTMRLVYYTASRDQLTERDLDAYHLAWRRGEWYVIGWCHLRKQVQTFAICRIKGLTLTDQVFEKPPDFDVTRYFESAFGVDNAGAPVDVVLEFKDPESRYVGEKNWHASQRLQKLSDGRLQVRLHVSVTYELRQWILSYGSRVRVVEPPALLKEIAAHLEEAAAQYR